METVIYLQSVIKSDEICNLFAIYYQFHMESVIFFSRFAIP